MRWPHVLRIWGVSSTTLGRAGNTESKSWGGGGVELGGPMRLQFAIVKTYY